MAGDELVVRLREFRRHGIHVLGSFIFGLRGDILATFDATVTVQRAARRAPSMVVRAKDCAAGGRASTLGEDRREQERTQDIDGREGAIETSVPE